MLVGFGLTVARLAATSASGREPARRAVGFGAIVSALLIVAAFLVNRNIFNSDNYRYLIFLVTPWSLGFGLVMRDLARRGRPAPGGLARRRHSGRGDDARHFAWYRDPLHYIDKQGILVQSRSPAWSKLAIRCRPHADPVDQGGQGSRYRPM